MTDETVRRIARRAYELYVQYPGAPLRFYAELAFSEHVAIYGTRDEFLARERLAWLWEASTR